MPIPELEMRFNGPMVMVDVIEADIITTPADASAEVFENDAGDQLTRRQIVYRKGRGERRRDR